MPSGDRSRNAGLALILFGLAAGMVGLSFAAVPLYRLFCQVTGYGGTTQVAEAPAGRLGERVMTIRFNADIDPALPWEFQPVQRAMTVRVGESALAFYRSRNAADHPITGVATFNVTPQKAGIYFDKVQCFCFDEQTLAAGEEVEMGVSFFVDPAIEDDPNLADVKTITLSYTFFASPDQSAAEAKRVSHDPGAAAASGSVN